MTKETQTTEAYEDDYTFYYERFIILIPVIKHLIFPTIFRRIVIILSLFGNILVVVISVYCMRLRSLTNVFILNLALSDLLFTVGLVLSVCKDIWDLTLEDAWCKAIAYTFAAGFYSHIMFLLLMSIQRYMALVHPNLGWKKRCCIICTLLGAWVVSILAAAVHILAFLASDCVITSETTSIAVIYVDNIVFVCAFLVMGFCYIRILQTICNSPTNQEHKVTGLAVILIVTFFIFWAPNKIMGFLHILKYHQIKSFTHVSEHFNYASHNCYLLGISRCCLNPLIYGLFGLKFHKEIRASFQRQSSPNSS